MNLKGKNAFITGGGKGLGKAVAETLASEGVNIGISGRNEEQLKKTCEEFRKYGVKVAYSVFDVSDKQSVKEGVSSIASQLGGIDIVVNNAGIIKIGTVENQSIEDWEAVINTNLFGVYYVAKAVIPFLKKSSEADMINIASTAGLKGSANMSAYSASKAAVIALSQSLMAELRKSDIRVITLTPSTIATDLTLENKFTDGNPDKVLQPEDFGQWVRDILKMNRRAMIANGSIFSTNP